jgi:hypothetical protein
MKRLRELAGATPAEALEAQRRKRNELIGEAVAQGKALPESTAQRGDLTLIADAVRRFRAPYAAKSSLVFEVVPRKW